MASAPRKLFFTLGVVLAVVVMASVQESVNAAGRPQPTNYVSQSGVYTLFVDPADRHGRGSATYRLSKNGVEVWSGEKPYTLREVTVTDDGLAAGMAYRQTWHDQNDSRSPDKYMHIVILGSEGREVLNEVKQRHDAPYTHGPTLPEMTQFIVDEDNDLVIARVQVRRAEWWMYRLSTGELTARIDPKMWMNEFPNLRYVVDAQLLPSTPLVLVHWYTKSTDYKVKDAGGIFALIHRESGLVWSFEAKEDYANIDFRRRLGGGPVGYFRKHPAILGTSPRGRFDLRLFTENKQASFVARLGEEGAWIVTELGRIDIPDDEPVETASVATDPLTYLGELKLTSSESAKSPFHGLWDFTFDRSGQIYFLKRAKEQPGTLYCADTSGKILAERPFGSGQVDWTQMPRTEDGRFFVSRSTKREDGDGYDVTAVWVELGTGKESTPKLDLLRRVAGISRFSDGGVVVLGSVFEKSAVVDGLIRYNADGSVRWRFDSNTSDGYERLGLGPRDVVVTTRDQIVLLSMSSVRILNGDGDIIKRIDLKGAFGNEEFGGRPSYLHETVADNDGGFLFADSSNPPVVLRYNADGSLRSRWSPRHADGKTFDLRPHIRVAPDGRLWTGDGESIMRLTDDGVVDLVLGPEAKADQLERIAALTVDGQGNYYAVAHGSGVIHVFDRNGQSKQIIEPDPTDVAGTVRESFIAVNDSGEVYVKKPRTKVYMPADEYLRFSPAGNQLETVTFEPPIPVGRFLSPGWSFQPETGYRCGICQIRGDTRLVIVDPPNRVVREERRRPNRKFFGDMTNLAMAPNGAMAILDRDVFDEAKVYEVDLFSAEGDPIRTIRLPPPSDRYSGIAFDGSRIVVVENEAVVVIDEVPGKQKRWSLSRRAEGGWDAFLLPTCNELLLLDRRARTLHRYELPKQVGSTDPEKLEGVAATHPESTDPSVQSPSVNRFLEIVTSLPNPRPCVAYIQKTARGERAMTEAQAMELPAEERGAMRTINLDECGTRLDAPLLYVRQLDLAASGGLEDLEGKRVLDFGCCDIRHLQSLARLGADVVAAQAGYSLTAMCNDWEDAGELIGPDDQVGHLSIIHGNKLGPDELAKSKGEGFDLITVRNILQHPAPDDYFAFDKWLQAGLGQDNESVVRSLFDLLVPGGCVLIYNVSFEPIPVENAMLREVWERAGFEILKFDHDDRGAAIAIGRQLEWEALTAETIRAGYTLLRRPVDR